MDRSKFFGSVRARNSGVFGTSLSQSQVTGTEVILDAGQNAGLPLRHLAYVLAAAYHETGGKMQPVTENLTYTSAARLREVWPSRFTSTAAAIPYVRNPQGLANRVYAKRMGNGVESSGDGWRYRGRALPQLTGRENYTKASRLVGVDLVANPDKANDSAISSRILIEGMRSGMFTGKRLSDYIAGDRADYVSARAIINDDVKANGKLVAGYAKAFETALREAGYIGQTPKTITIPPEKPASAPEKAPATPPQPPAQQTAPVAAPESKRGIGGLLKSLFALIFHKGA